MGISTVKTIFHIGPIPISNTIIWTWLIFIILTVFLLFLARNLKLHPTGRSQMICEYLVDSVRNLVKTTMGEDNVGFGGYFFTIAGFLIFSNVSGFLFLGIVRPPTADLVTTLTLGIFTFFMCQFFAIKSKGFGGYIKSTFLSPFAFMLPLNIISEIANPVSLAFRLFGNIFGGMIITGLIYAIIAGNIYTTGFVLIMSLILNILIYTGKIQSLNNKAVKIVGIILLFPSLFAAFGHAYFDVFSGLIQTFIFCMLSMVFVSSAIE